MRLLRADHGGEDEQRHEHERRQVDWQKHAERGDADGERRGVAGVQHGWAHSFVESRCASVPGELAEIEEVAPLHVIGSHHPDCYSNRSASS